MKVPDELHVTVVFSPSKIGSGLMESVAEAACAAPGASAAKRIAIPRTANVLKECDVRRFIDR